MEQLNEYIYCMIYVISLLVCVSKYICRKISQIELIVFVLIYGLIDLIMTSAAISSFLNDIVISVLVVLSDYIAICLLNRKKQFYLLFYTLTFNTIYIFTANMMNYLLQYVDGFEVLMTFNQSMVRLSFIICLNLITILFFKVFERKKIIPVIELVSGSELILCIINLFVQMVFLIFQWLSIDGMENLYIHLILLSFICLWLILLSSMNRSLELNYGKEKYLFSQSIEQRINQYIIQYKRDEEKIRKIKHDMRNHLVIINELNTNDEVKNYIHKILDEINTVEISSSKTSGNIFIDAIINSKQMEYPSVSISGCFGLEQLKMDSYDLSVLIFNLVDNACFAANKVKGTVDINMRYSDNHLFIEVINDCKEKMNNKNNKGKGHGYGLRIINDIVTKYNGEIDFLLTENTTAVNIALTV